MIARRSVLAGLGLGTLAACGAQPRSAGQIAYWGASGDALPTQQSLIDTFTAQNPGTSVVQSQVPSGNLNSGASIITAVRGGTAPDVWLLDRFATAQYASLGMLEPLDPLIERYSGTDVATYMSSFMDFSVGEATYDGQIYGLPTETDSRGLFYNRKMLRDAGFDPAELDPANGPVTFDRIAEMNEALTTTDARGNIETIGWVPWMDESNGYTWSLANGATYFDEGSCTVDMLADPVLRAYEQIEAWRDELDFGKVDVFLATYQADTSTSDTFLTERRAFLVTSPWYVARISKYAPDLDWAVTHLPVHREGDTPYTWSGGRALVTPKGSTRSEQVWNFMDFFAGPVGQEMYMKPLTLVPTDRQVAADPEATDPSIRFFVDELQYSTSRPPLPVGQLVWDASMEAMQSILYSGESARSALRKAQDRITPQMNPYCPFTLPDGFGTVGV